MLIRDQGSGIRDQGSGIGDRGGDVSYTVGQVAALTHVSVRTLHHYDEIGLLSPSGRTEAGYRRYSEGDLERLRQILFYRELGFSLDRIALVVNGDGDTLAHLVEQQRLLHGQIERLQAMAVAVARALETEQMGIALTPEERFEVFGTFKPEDHEDEVRARWGETPAFVESRRRTASYSKADWLRIKAEAADIVAAFVTTMRSGTPPTNVAAMDLAERHRQHISQWFYACSRNTHAGLGEMYVSDPRFTAVYEQAATGLAVFMRDAIVANAARMPASPR
jgi:DNA-binding transcriptional MerR regulator